MQIVHFGVGNFHRAHQAWYTQHAGDGWQIVGVSLRSPAMRDALQPNDFNYTHLTKGGGETEAEQITVLKDILVAPEAPHAVIEALCAPQTQMVTLTITEKGFCLAPGSDKLDPSHPDIAHDLANPDALRTAIGFLAHAIARRKENGMAPLTIISCDNQTDNGRKLEQAVKTFSQHAGLAVDPGTQFPNTMVDRITPATTDALRDEVTTLTGTQDPAPVETEQFSQWVIEDRFAGKHPDWARAGAEIVADVGPYERRKLRMLNGAHSLLAYQGVIAGHAFVHQAIADPPLRRLTIEIMEAAAQTLADSPMDMLKSYAKALVQRFENPALNHRLRQIAMDGSLKIPLRHLDVAADLIAMDGNAQAHAKAVAGWISFLRHDLAAKRAIEDPRADELAKIIGSAGALSQIVRQLLATIDGRDWPDAWYRQIEAEIARLDA
ncbi:MAG: mannitol dehydrogenase family protein [Pseudomonadota bacterium]